MTAATGTLAVGSAPALRSLYFVRFGFAVVWAGLVALTASDLGVAAAVLLVVYPLFDVGAAVVDARSSRSRELVLNIVISSLAALGLVFAATSGSIPATLRVWGAWAILSGIVQLVVALKRRKLGGQWAMILSGGISTLAGASFIVMASQDGASLTSLAGYAAIGGVFFLVSAIRLGQAARTA
ncbi:hypothetical protein [Umezawaea sp. Da 62-37]|uniref:hypothetical protein n=1 Tax=Umezawaea sp. Da 62-37 TaxID=3075927 RepID=UPI0028F73F67|nr:hypothetical protein [Umezawaea sp. Da 62-37]WNV91290.1 hypothetical protein RM788_24365 [Umezawaea sp. Da 62-37]